jgi:predicted esterase
MGPISEKVARPTYSDLGEPEPIIPLFPDDVSPAPDLWDRRRVELREAWGNFLGRPSFREFDRTTEVIEVFEHEHYTGTVLKQPVSPSIRQRLLLMEPHNQADTPCPGAVLPFYDPDRTAGIDLGTHDSIRDGTLIQFGRHLVQQGYTVACTEAFPYNTVPAPEDEAGFAWWQAGAEKLLQDNPSWTGMGRLAWDASRALDLLLDRPGIDADRVAIMGHSLGGKIAFYSGSLDDRFAAAISSDFGMGFGFTNWEAPWYLGERILDADFPLAHHQVLALQAPRPFLLIGGEADRPATWQYIAEAKRIYELYGSSSAVGFFDHASGHRPTEESLHIAYGWLAEQFGLEPRPWAL